MICVSSEGRPWLGLRGQRLAPPAHPPHAVSAQISQGDESSQEKARSIGSPGEKVGAQDGQAEGSLPLVTQPGVPVSSRLPGGLRTGTMHQWHRGQRPHGRPGSPASLAMETTDGGRRVSGDGSSFAQASRPCHHHRFGGSSATLLLNKVISSRCTMGTSRMTSVRPSWSRGKMTTFSAGRSAWKLNQRQAVSRAHGGHPQEGGHQHRLGAQASPYWGLGVVTLLSGHRGGTHKVPGRGMGAKVATLEQERGLSEQPVCLAVGGVSPDREMPGSCRTKDGTCRGVEKGHGQTHRFVNPQATLEGNKLPSQVRQQLCQEKKPRQPPGARSYPRNM